MSFNSNLLIEKWKIEEVEGSSKVEKPPYCIFNNTAHALSMLYKHINNKSKIVLHCDVDVDGFGTTYILDRFLTQMGNKPLRFMLNGEKTHGIQQKYVDFFNNPENSIDLLIISDSSSNEIDIIKQFKCDVLVIDHHEILHNDTVGKCLDGNHNYVIVNNIIDNINQEIDISWLEKIKPGAFNNIEEYHGNADMSCGLVVYELLRVYCRCLYDEKLLENLMLFQWVGVTLFTDMINLLNKRNQWYMEMTVMSNNGTEPTLLKIMNIQNKYKNRLDKSYITYTFAPLINKAIRAGAGLTALGIILRQPDRILELKQYEQFQTDAINKATTIKIKDPTTELEILGKRKFDGEYVILNIADLGISKNYNGVIASRISGDHNKNAAVYTITESGLCKGSFRGRCKGIDYRKYFDNFSSDIYAQGHPAAFGFELREDQLIDIMSSLKNIEPDNNTRKYLTIGNIETNKQGENHIDVDNIQNFKQNGFLWRIGTGNAKVVSTDEILIGINRNDLKYKNSTGKVTYYDLFGLECKALSPITGDDLNLYLELGTDLSIYIK